VPPREVDARHRTASRPANPWPRPHRDAGATTSSSAAGQPSITRWSGPSAADRTELRRVPGLREPVQRLRDFPVQPSTPCRLRSALTRYARRASAPALAQSRGIAHLLALPGRDKSPSSGCPRRPDSDNFGIACTAYGAHRGGQPPRPS
jgi:hypothetical protein